MKRIEDAARDYSWGRAGWREQDALEEAFEAGARWMREMAFEQAKRFTHECIAESMLELGEDEVE